MNTVVDSGSESTENCAEYWPSGEKETTTVLDKFTIKKIDKSEEIAPGTVRTKLEVKGYGTLHYRNLP